MKINLFVVFGLTRPGLEPESTVSVADALSSWSLIKEKSPEFEAKLNPWFDKDLNRLQMDKYKANLNV